MASVRDSQNIISPHWPESSRLSSAAVEEKSNKASDHEVDDIAVEDQKPVAVADREHCFMVIFPAVAQLIVNKSPLQVSSVVLSNPTPHGNDLSLEASIRLATPLGVHIKPVPLSLYVNDGTKDIVPYTKVVLPEANLKGNSSIKITDQPTEILDKPMFKKFVHSALFEEDFTLSVTGPTSANVGKLKAEVHMQKDIHLKGLNKLAGFSIPDARIVLPAEPDGTNMRANLSLPNASVLKIDMGNLTFNMMIGGITLGKANIENVILSPGNNTVAARCTLDVKKALANLRQILASQKGILSTGSLAISASGNSTIYNGQHLDYYEDVLKQLTLTTQLALLPVLFDSLRGILGSQPDSPILKNLSSILPLLSGRG
ncbi:hypothetical protein V494_03015 [Pseudogymnoascus sp. VKM F-4513 (FW-928)]|nr:hypothetical protein V494_03015 [Pseudogymnoascus sp. VKM F-4513 (FW-928)]